jgi:hypothetical protein
MDTCGGRICDLYDGDICALLKTDTAEQNGDVDKACEKMAKIIM